MKLRENSQYSILHAKQDWDMRVQYCGNKGWKWDKEPNL